MDLIRKLNNGSLTADESKLALLLLWNRSKENYVLINETNRVERSNENLFKYNQSKIKEMEKRNEYLTMWQMLLSIIVLVLAIKIAV